MITIPWSSCHSRVQRHQVHQGGQLGPGMGKNDVLEHGIAAYQSDRYDVCKCRAKLLCIVLSCRSMLISSSVCASVRVYSMNVAFFLGYLPFWRTVLKCFRFSKYSWLSPASMAQLDAPSDWRPGGRGFNPRRGRQHSFVEIDHEIFSTVILSLPLIHEGQLSVSGERLCTILVNRLED